MHALIVTAHPVPQALTHAVAGRIAAAVADAGHSVELADLAAEGFDPRFTAHDIAVHLRQAPPTADVAAEQSRIERAQTLVLVFPVYWWSMPGLLKGWIDRVFSNGWAYDEDADTQTVRKLQHLRVHLVALGGADMRTYARHGYFAAMRTQIDHGIFGYCGARVGLSELLLASETETGPLLASAYALGSRILGADQHSAVADAA
jgi:NAD(P)H dehydrogenase (quinone)